MSLPKKKNNAGTKIKGFTVTKQKILRHSLNISTYQELAEYPPNIIRATLIKAKHSVSLSQVKSWQKAAKKTPTKEFAGGEIDKTSIESNKQADSIQRDKQAAIKKAEDTAVSQAKKKQWRWLGAFIVEFRESVENGTSKEYKITVEQRKIDERGSWLDDEKEKNSTPINGEQLYEWMVSKLGEGVWPEEIDKSVVQPPQTEKTPFDKQEAEELIPELIQEEVLPLTVAIEKMLVFQPPNVETPIGVCQAGQPFIGFIQSGKPFALEVTFTLPQLVATEIPAKEITYKASFYAKVAGSRISLDHTQPQNIFPRKTLYKARLSEAILQPGICCLGVLVTIQDKFPKIAHFDTPYFHVI